MKSKYIILGCLIILQAIFAYTAFTKIRDFSFFNEQLNSYPYIHQFHFAVALVPIILESLIALYFVLVIIKVGQVHLLPRNYTKYGFLASGVLVSAFTIYLIVMVLTDSNLPCTCGGILSFLSWKQHIWVNLFLLSVSVVGYRLANREQSSQHYKYTTV